MRVLTVLSCLMASSRAIPDDMNRGERNPESHCISLRIRKALHLSFGSKILVFAEKCVSNGVYKLLKPGELIPCSPVCDKAYKLEGKNSVTSKSIDEHCQFDHIFGTYYHKVANRSR